MGQRYSEDHVFPLVLLSVFPLVTLGLVYGMNAIPTSGPIPVSHTSRTPFGRTAKPEYGRSAIGAEMTIIFPRTKDW